MCLLGKYYEEEEEGSVEFVDFDKFGCEFGRSSREKTILLEKEIELLKTKFCHAQETIEELKEELSHLFSELQKLQSKIAWIAGGFAAAGSLFGAILNLLLRIGGH